LTYVGDTAAIADAVERFIAGLRSAATAEQVLATVLAVASANDLGGRAATRAALGRFHGRELQRSSHGVVLAAFDGPGRAIRCAQTLLAMIGGGTRAAVQIGECRGAGNALTGPALDAAVAAAQAAVPGELLVSGTVRDLVVDPTLRYRERPLTFGVPGRLYSVTAG
jgi:hypothetical protein